MSTPVVRMRGVTKHYRDVVALDGVDLELGEHRIHGLLGRNGAGKTTIMQVLTGHILATAGEVEVFGERPYENASVLQHVCFIREAQKYPDGFRIKDALGAGALVFDDWDAALAEQLVEEFRLLPRRQIKKLSRGQLSAVGVIVGLASRAPLTFFDEPYLGLDAVARQLFYDRLLADYAEHPRTIVLSTHLIDEVSDLIENVVVIDGGRVLIDESADALRSRAVIVSGPTAVVLAFAAGHTVLHREELGGHLRLTLAGVDPAPELRGHGLEFEPVSLQQLVVRTTQHAATTPRPAVTATTGKVLS